MASVQSTRASKYARRGVMEDEPPDHLESAGELLIKQLVQKQTNTNITLDQQLQEKKKFERGIGFVSLDELSVGTSSLKQFEERRQQAERLGELEGRGLTRQEAVAVVLGVRSSKATPEAQAAALAFVDQHLHNQPVPTNSCSNEAVKRQEWEAAVSVKPKSVETRLYQFAMKNSSDRSQVNWRPLDHPVYQLAAMEQNLLHSADPQTLAKTIQRKRRQQVERMSDPVLVHFKAPDRQQSLWDVIESPEALKKKPSKNIATYKKQMLYTVREGKIVQICDEDKGSVEQPETEQRCKPSGQLFVSLESPNEKPEILGRLSEEEIRQLPRFKNYKRGQISKTLYIKNLFSNVTEAELAAVFDEFQESSRRKITFRLMTGKMRGQAFVTFPDCEKATMALERVNGCILKGKPIVIQYGRQQD